MLFSFLFVPWKFQLKPTRPFFCYRAMPIASINYSVKPFVDLFNTWHGQLMVKVSIVISSDKKMLKEGEPVPEIFTDPAFGQSSHWELNTSQLSSRYVDGWGYDEGEFHKTLYTFPASFSVLFHNLVSH
jgi:hypothetical protein